MRKLNIAICLLLIAAVCGATWYYWPYLPERVPVHWNFAGQVDRYASRITMLLTGPGVMTGALALGLILPWLSPRGYDVSRFESAFNYIVTLTVGLFAYIFAIELSAILHGGLHIGNMTMGGLCVMMVLLGNQLGKVRRNFYIGVRTPWTLASERVWYATHRLSARLMVASGLLGLAALWAGAPHWLMLASVSAWAVIAVLYSLLLYKRLEKNHELEVY